MSTFQKTIDYLPIKCIDFTFHAKSKKKILDDVIDSNACSQTERAVMVREHLKIPNGAEMDLLYKHLSTSATKPGVLSLVEEIMYPQLCYLNFLSHCHRFITQIIQNYDLLEKCESVLEHLNVTPNMAFTVEKKSIKQYQSRIWFRYRAGRITVSKMKSSCHTDAANPAQSLVKSICYPESFVFRPV